MTKTTVLTVTAIASAFTAYYYYNRYNELAHMFRLYTKLSEVEHDIMIKMIDELKNNTDKDESE